MEIVKSTSLHNTNTSSVKKTNIVIHYTAGVTSRKGSALNVANFFKHPNSKGSADFIVDDETIVQYNPDLKRYATWHCGGMKYANKGGSMYGKVTNNNSIGIEICSSNSKGKMMQANDGSYYFTDKVLEKAEELIHYLIKQFKINPANIYRHYDCTGKLCPGICGWNIDSGDDSKWKAFKKKFTNLDNAETEKKPKPKKEIVPQIVPMPNETQKKIKLDNASGNDSKLAGTYIVNSSTGLNLRQGYSTNKSVILTLPNKAIVENYGYYGNGIDGKWLLVKYGEFVGYVSMKYLKKGLMDNLLFNKQLI